MFSVWVASFPLISQHNQVGGAQVLAITNVTLIPVAAAPAPERREHMAVVIDAGRISAIGPSSEVTIPRGAR